MNLNDPNLGTRMELRAMEAQILSNHPQVRRGSPVKALLLILVILILMIVGVIMWMNSLAVPEVTS